MFQPRLIPMIALVLVSGALFAGCGDDGPSAPTVDPSVGFRGEYAPDNWTRTGITASTSPPIPAMRRRSSSPTTSFSAIRKAGSATGTASSPSSLPGSGTVSFDWNYSGFHSWYRTQAVLIVFSGDDEAEVFNGAVGGGFDRSGSFEMEVEAGQTFGFIIGGKNFDSNSRLRGTLMLSNFRHP